jgi:ketosteroid isomerase-like protein
MNLRYWENTTMRNTEAGPTILSLTFATAALVLTACGGAGPAAEAPPAVDTALEAETILELDLEWVQRYADRDMGWITALHAENAVQLPPGSDIIEGSAAIGAAWEAMAGVFPEVTWEPTMAKVSASGDMAYLYGQATGVDVDGNVIPMKFMEVWVKIDGEWKVAADMFNANVQ